MSAYATDEECEKFLEFLRYSFGGFPLSDVEAHAYRVVFRSGTKAEVRRAIEELIVVTQHRPSPNDVAVRLRLLRRRDEPAPEPFPEPSPDVAAKWIARCRETLRKAGANVRRPA